MSITGIKTELQERLQTALLEGDISLEDTAIAGVDLLEEEDVLTDEDEKGSLVLPVGSDENELLKSPTSSGDNSLKDSPPTSDIALNSSINVTQMPSRKIILKRKNSFSNSLVTSQLHTTKENTEPTAEKIPKSSKTYLKIDVSSNANDESSKAAPAKITQLSMQERLEMRAKKFGISQDPTPTYVIEDDEEKQIETLKKRAERFGCVLSSTIAKIDADEKLLKRKLRFGDVGKATTSKSSSSDSYAEKARQRLERFSEPTAAKTKITVSK